MNLKSHCCAIAEFPRFPAIFVIPRPYRNCFAASQSIAPGLWNGGILHEFTAAQNSCLPWAFLFVFYRIAAAILARRSIARGPNVPQNAKSPKLIMRTNWPKTTW